MSAARGFDPDALEAPLAPLDVLARGMWLQGIVNGIGRLPARLEALESLSTALVAGVLPPTDDWRWPDGPALAAFRAALADLDLARYCRDRREVAEQVLTSLLWHTDRIADYREDGDEAAAVARAVDAFREDWRFRTGEMDELIYVLGELGDALKAERWDRTRGLLRSAGWQEMLRIRRLLEDLPDLRALIRRLGRAHQTDETDDSTSLQVQVFEQATVAVPQRREVHVPDMPGETQGVKRSGNIARMLASEALLLRHPRLRLIWFARHAERILLTYEDRDVLAETVMVESREWRPTHVRRPDRRMEMGPMIVCVDTSGSMQGACEQVAKALVLEAMRTAAAQRRACHLFAFGGPGEIAERELRPGCEGIEAAIEFLSQAFHGGTEVSEPLERALAKLEDARWRLADLLLASDGEFGATPQVAQRLRRAREELGLRVQGVLIGDRETLGMLELCDHIHWVRDWRRFGAAAAAADSPVPSKSLTAMYFPNALR